MAAHAPSPAFFAEAKAWMRECAGMMGVAKAASGA